MTEFIPPGTRFHPLPSPFRMKRGGALHGARVAYETWGTLNERRDNAVLIVTGLSPDAHAARNPGNPEEGWWEPMLGPGKPIDTDRWFVVCVNSLGSCHGSTGAASIDPRTGDLYRLTFPVLTIEDVATAAREALRAIGLPRVRAVVGPSLGGMTALAFEILFQGISDGFVSMSSGARSLPFSIALRSTQREMIRKDPQWMGGNYPRDAQPLTSAAKAPSGSSPARADSSRAVGGAVSVAALALSTKPVRCTTSSRVTRGFQDSSASRPLRFCSTAMGVTTVCRLPAAVTKSSFSTSARFECSVRQVATRFAVGIMTAAPPPPGSLTFGRSHGPMTETLVRPSASTCAQPRKTRSMPPRAQRS